MAKFTEVMKQKQRMCAYYNDLKNTQISCDDCNLRKFSSMSHCNCSEVLELYPQEAEELIMKWAEEHPAQTNKDKFREVFGVEPSLTNCVGIKCPEKCKNADDCAGCNFKDFWEKEYKEPKEVE